MYFRKCKYIQRIPGLRSKTSLLFDKNVGGLRKTIKLDLQPQYTYINDKITVKAFFTFLLDKRQKNNSKKNVNEVL